MSVYNRHLLMHELAEKDGLSPKQIAERLNISARTVKRHLSQEQYLKQQKRKISRKIDPYKKRIKELLERHGYTAAQIFRILKDEGYSGCESVLREYVSIVRPRPCAAYLTLYFEPGQTAQVDFAECGFVDVGQKRRKLYAFVMSLGYSRMMFVKFILRQNMEHFLTCHREAFEYFKGVTKEVMVDNCKVAVKTPCPFGMPEVNERYADCARHYGFKIVPTGVRKPHEKGRVERSISYLRTSFLNGLDMSGLSLAALNHGARQWMENVANVRIHGTTRKAPSEMFEAEKKNLLELPLFPYDCGVAKTTRANSQYRVFFESNKYSVPPEFAGKMVELSIYPEKLLIRSEGRVITEHVRCYEERRDCVLKEHDNALVEQRRKAKCGVILRRFLELGAISESYYQEMKARRLNPVAHVKKIMALSDVYGKDETVRALEDAKDAGAFGSDYIANILEARKRVPTRPGPLHLSRKSDYLDIDLGEPDMNDYDVN